MFPVADQHTMSSAREIQAEQNARMGGVEMVEPLFLSTSWMLHHIGRILLILLEDFLMSFTKWCGAFLVVGFEKISSHT